MAKTDTVVSFEFDLDKKIDAEREKIVDADALTLPDDTSVLVADYVRKIEGTYDVTRSKQDTDNTIDLLYIAYNTTPQGQGQIRVGIDKIMTALIDAQQQSQRKMESATRAARYIVEEVGDIFADWEEVRGGGDSGEIVGFLEGDLIDLATTIRETADTIRADLDQVAAVYDGIIEQTSTITRESEVALGEQITNKEALEREINAANAERLKLETLMDELQQAIRKYEKMANEYKSQAETAEERAFIMGLVRVGAQMVAAAAPAIAMAATGAATGGASIVASSAASTVKQMTQSDAAEATDDKTADAIEKKKERADEKAKITAAEAEKKKLEKTVKELEGEKKKVEADAAADADIKATKIDALIARIEAAEEGIEAQNKVIATAKLVVEGLTEALKALDRNMEEMGEKQEEHAKNLRAMQMEMINKVESYENEKRAQAGELVKINALLTGQRSEEETIQLVIRSLNLSIKSLKRAREIIVEMSFFFKSFSSFMTVVIEDTGRQVKAIERATKKDELSESALGRVVRRADDFFVTQTAQWYAVARVSALFVDNFTDGWTKLNRLSGRYLDGDELRDYLTVAADRIDEISFARQEAARATIASLDAYRAQVQAGQ
jgi:hypothetical protein